MKNKIIYLVLPVILVLFPALAFSQFFDYRRTESPSPSWNNSLLYDAKMVGAAGISFYASERSAGNANPALIPLDGPISFGASADFFFLTAFQYATYNYGYYADNLRHRESSFSITSASIALPLGSIGFSAGWNKHKLYDMPDYEILSDQYGTSHAFSHEGWEDMFYLSGAFRLADNLHLGLKAAYITGWRDTGLQEITSIRISQDESYTWDYVILTGGAFYSPSPAIEIAGSFEYSTDGKVEEEISRSFDAVSIGGVSIRSSYTAEDTIYRPNRATLGIRYIPEKTDRFHKRDFSIAVEGSFNDWSNYRHISFGEEIERDMKNTFELAVAVEKFIHYKDFTWSLRGGYRMDIQPIRLPEVTLHWFTAGMNVIVGNASIHMAAAVIMGDEEAWGHSDTIISMSMDFFL